jgi:AcrR family transcriptional regulator
MSFMQNGTKNPKRPRGRPRAYDGERALDGATKAFWQAGYAATSLDALGAATGMNRPSLYAAFGDKHALYLATLERYARRAKAAMRAALDEDLPLADALARVYDGALALYFPPGEPPRGCFLIGTALTESVEHPQVREQLHAALRAFDRAFEERLRLAQRRGELDADADTRALAGVASALLHTLALRSRAGDGRAALRAVAREGIRLICGTAPAKRRGRRTAAVQ